MTDTQAILFGSFSEDEAKAFQSAPMGNCSTNSQFISPDMGTLMAFRTDKLFGDSAVSLSSKQRVAVLTPKRVVTKQNHTSSKGGSEPSLSCLYNENGVLVPEEDPRCSASALKGDRFSESTGNKDIESFSSKEESCNQNQVNVEFSAAKDTFNEQYEEAVVHGQEQMNGFIVHGERLEKYIGEVSTARTDTTLSDSADGEREEFLNKTTNRIISKADLSKELQSIGRNLQPRGLVNTGNSCFLNATLQALLSCPPFWHLVQSLRTFDLSKKGYPTLQAMSNLVGEFESQSVAKNYVVKEQSEEDSGYGDGIEIGRPFAPTMFEPVLRNFNPETYGATRRNRQEDAQEFLSYMMNRMHEELLQLTSAGPKQSGSPRITEEDEWETVGPKNRTAITRVCSYQDSPLSEVFGGQIRSIVRSKGSKASATVQPFLLLHLEIVPEAVHSVEDALKLFAAPESLEGYKSTGKAEIVTASKSIKIQSLPKILILHLMRFNFGAKGAGKVNKPVHFPLEFTLERELLSSPFGSGSEAHKYELIATITHHGKDHSMGHYTADTKQSDGRWLRFDDGMVSFVNLNRVLHDQAYLLFYKRSG